MKEKNSPIILRHAYYYDYYLSTDRVQLMNNFVTIIIIRDTINAGNLSRSRLKQQRFATVPMFGF